MLSQVSELLAGEDGVLFAVRCALKNLFFLNHGMLYVTAETMVFSSQNERFVVRIGDIESVRVSDGEGLAVFDGIGFTVRTRYGAKFQLSEMAIKDARAIGKFLKSRVDEEGQDKLA